MLKDLLILIDWLAETKSMPVRAEEARKRLAMIPDIDDRLKALEQYAPRVINPDSSAG
jgi:hypothetical protein